MRKRLLVLLVLVFSVMGALTTGSAVRAHLNPASRSAVVDSATAARTTAVFRPSAAQSATNPCQGLGACGLQVYYDIYNDLCGVFNSNSSNWGSCRNQDEALTEWRAQIVRIYYSPNYSGAWACLPAFEAYFNLNHANQTFNNGSGRPGFGQQVWLNVASSAFGTGTCSNPLPGGTNVTPPGH
jgi:hypothetical protein